MQAEIDLMQPQAKEPQESPELEESRKDSSPEPLEEHGPADTLISDF